MAKILLVEDDDDLCENIEDWLVLEKHLVEVTRDGSDARALMKDFSFDLIILDWGLPNVTGIELLKEFRRNGGLTPVLMLTGKDKIEEREFGLDSGSDDYLTKPFDLRELSARVRALLRRSAQSATNVLKAGYLELDTTKCTLLKEGSLVSLLPKEYALLEFLMRHPNQIFDADKLLDRVWGSDQGVGTETVRTWIMRLRKKIDIDGKDSMITNVRGLGYRLDSQDKRD